MSDPITETVELELVPAPVAPGSSLPTFNGENGTATPAGDPWRLPETGTVIGGRYRIGELIDQRETLLRFRGMDLGSGQNEPLPIVILRDIPSPDADPSPPVPRLDPPSGTDDPESFLADTKIEDLPNWPTIAWEKRLLARTPHLSMPRMLDLFTENGFEYLIEEVPVGQSFWDAWEEASWPRRCTWLAQIAEALDELHGAGALLDGLRPDIVIVTPTSQAVVSDLTGLLPLPVPATVTARSNLYSAPEVTLGSGRADARADLYSFGAMVQALLLGREITDLDFTKHGVPRPFLERFPDAHPMLGRLLARTFERELDLRFPSQDMIKVDPTGFQELIDTVKTCGRTLGTIRLDVAAWTNTGVIRSANEDAIAVLHSCELRLDDSDDFAMIALADGMGGMASGEVAAALTVQTVRDFFLRNPPFTELHVSPPPEENQPPVKPPDYQNLVLESLRTANRVVHEQARKNTAQRGMGCTAEVVLIDGKKVYIGHVGDSRTYRLRQGKLKQITEDQTLVSQLVALGQLTEDEAETHPQRAELQQAIGGRRDVYPDFYMLQLEPGDWIVVCSDGLSNQLRPNELISVVQNAGSAEKAARRLVNQAILEGAFDNVSVVVARAC